MNAAKMQPTGWACCSGQSNKSIEVLHDQDLSRLSDAIPSEKRKVAGSIPALATVSEVAYLQVKALLTVIARSRRVGADALV
jgi:hypothetical protein